MTTLRKIADCVIDLDALVAAEWMNSGHNYVLHFVNERELIFEAALSKQAETDLLAAIQPKPPVDVGLNE